MLSLNEGLLIQHFECSDVVKVRGRITFVFQLVLPRHTDEKIGRKFNLTE